MTVDTMRNGPIRRYVLPVLAVLVLSLVGLAGPADAATGAKAKLTGTVVGPSGPVAGAKVAVLDAASSKVLTSTSTAKSGSFTVGSLAPGKVKVKITKAGYLTWYAKGRTSLATADVLRTQAGKTLKLGTATLTAEAAIEGSVLGHMDPIDDAKVEVLDAATGRVIASKTAVSGDYRIGGLPAGKVKVRASKTGWTTSYASAEDSLANATVYTLVAGKTLTQSWDDEMRLFLDLIPLGTLTGKVVDGAGAPLGGATVRAYGVRGPDVFATVTSKADGTFTLPNLPVADYKIGVSKAGLLAEFYQDKPTLETADVVEPEGLWTTDLGTFRLDAPVTVTGQVLGWMDPLGGATVTVVDAATGATLAKAMADGSGYYTITGLRPGAIKVFASKPGWVTSYASAKSTLADATVYTTTSGQVLSQTWDDAMVLYLDLQPA